MPSYQGQQVKSRPLTKNDAKHGSEFDPNQEQVVITHNDGREEIVPKDQVQG